MKMQGFQLENLPKNPRVFPIPRRVLNEVIHTYEGFSEGELRAVDAMNDNDSDDPAALILSHGRHLPTDSGDYLQAYHTGVEFGATVARRALLRRLGSSEFDYQVDRMALPFPADQRFVLAQYFRAGSRDVKQLLRATVEKTWVAHHVHFIETTSTVPPPDDPFVVGVGDALQGYALTLDDPITKQTKTALIHSPHTSAPRS